MTATVTVRLMREGDAQAVAELCGQLGYPATPSEVLGRFQRLARREDARVFVAEDEDGGIAGWTHVYVEYLLESDNGAELGGLVVADGSRGRGVGRALLAAAEEWARERGCRYVRVRSKVERTAAHAFYEHVGYVQFKTQKNFRKPL
jgi:GNAT superfamily N-acetyltransferase